MSGVWTVSKLTGHRFGSTVGPAAMVTAVVLWVALQGLGWALVYVPHIPGGFVYSSGVDPAQYNDFVEALAHIDLRARGLGIEHIGRVTD